MKNQGKQIGLIAGGGPFPVLFAQKARKKGYDVHAIGFYNETDQLLSGHVNDMEILYLGQVGRLIDFFKKREISAAVMVGAIHKPTSVMDIRPDIRALSMYARMRKNTHDDRVLRTFADILEKEGIRIFPSTFLLPELLAAKGCWTRRKPTRQEKSDIRLGWKMAKEDRPAGYRAVRGCGKRHGACGGSYRRHGQHHSAGGRHFPAAMPFW
jgi:UDP-2,3-diacylglucosamine hydrolase